MGARERVHKSFVSRFVNALTGSHSQERVHKSFVSSDQRTLPHEGSTPGKVRYRQICDALSPTCRHRQVKTSLERVLSAACERQRKYLWHQLLPGPEIAVSSR